jgi:hypothetical protein
MVVIAGSQPVLQPLREEGGASHGGRTGLDNFQSVEAWHSKECGPHVLLKVGVQGFVGRGEMSRGGLLLRSSSLGQPAEYVPAASAVRRGETT